MTVSPEPWLRGAVPGIPPELMPAAHALLHVSEDIERMTTGLSAADLGIRPGGAASIAFHLKHLVGSLDRLLTYARGDALSVEQHAALRAEAQDDAAGESPAALVSAAQMAIARALAYLGGIDVAMLRDPRAVGRRGLPTTVGGLIFHAAEHAQRHAGQIATTAKVVRGGGPPGGPD
jgi:hypothetical protein